MCLHQYWSLIFFMVLESWVEIFGDKSEKSGFLMGGSFTVKYFILLHLLLKNKNK